MYLAAREMLYVNIQKSPILRLATVDMLFNEEALVSVQPQMTYISLTPTR